MAAAGGAHLLNPRKPQADTPPSAGKRAAGWRAAKRQRQTDANERDRRQRQRRNRRRPQSTSRPPALPLALLATALAWGIKPAQASKDLNITAFRLERAMRGAAGEAYEHGEQMRLESRQALRAAAPPRQPHQRNVLEATAKPMADALAVGVSLRQAAVDVGIDVSTLSRALRRADDPAAADYLVNIRQGYETGEGRRATLRAELRAAAVARE